MSYFEKPVLVMFTSMPGSGKSYFARQASERMHAVRLSSDALRPAIYGSVEAWRLAEETNGRPEMLKQLFGAMDYAGDQILRVGHDLIHDTNTNKRELRHITQERAKSFGAVPVVIHLEVPYDVALKRGQEREEQADQRRQDEAGMQALIERIQAATDPFDEDEPVITLNGQAPFDEQFITFETQVREFING